MTSLTRAQIVLRYAAVALAASSWGTWPLILRRADAIAPMPTALTSTIVMGVMTIASGAVVLVDRARSRAPSPRPNRRAWAGIAWLGVADALNFVLFFAAYRTTSVAIAVITHYLTPIFVAIAAPLVLHERATRRTAVAVVVSFAGLLLLLGPWNAERHARDGLGAAFGAGSAVFYAANVLVNKRLGSAFRPSELVCFHGIVATPLLAVFVPPDAWAAIDPHALAVIVGGALGPGALAGLLFVWGLRDLPATHVSTLTLLEPLVAVIAGAVAFGEHLASLALAGAALILAGAAAVVSQRRLAK